MSKVRPDGTGPETPAEPAQRRWSGIFRGARPGHSDEWDIEHADPDPKGRSLMLLGLILMSVLFSASAQIVLKHGMNHVTHELGRPFKLDAGSLRAAGTSFWVWVGIVLFALAAFVWLAVLSRAALSFAYPFAGLTYVVIVLYDTVRGEAVSGLRWGGVALIIAGIVLVSRTPSHS